MRSTKLTQRHPGTMLVVSAAVMILPLLPAGARAQNAAPEALLTLPKALEEARRQRPLLASDAARVGAARARITQARSGLLPRVDLQGSATDGPLGAPAMGLGGLVGTPIKKHTGGSLNLVQTLLDFGRTHNLVRARRDEALAAEELRLTDENRVSLEVEQAYLQALQGRRLLAVNREIEEQRRLVARQAATLFQNGLSSRVDVDLAEANVAQSRLAVARAQAELDNAYAQLSAAIGRPIATDTVLEDVVPAPSPAASLPPPGTARPAPPVVATPPAPSLEEALATALRARPELRRGASLVRLQEHLTAAARAGKAPLLTGVASVGKVNPVPLFESTDKPWAVGLALTVPIFTGRLVEGQVEEARQNTRVARGELTELTLTVRQQVTSAAANLAASEEGVRAAEVELASARDALSLATRRYQTQLGTIVELTQAQVIDAQAENDLVRAQYDRELARAALAFATGQDYQPVTGVK